MLGSGLLGEGLLGKVAQDPFVEGGEGVEFGGCEQVDHVLADMLHVQGGGLLDGAASGGQKADHDATGIGGVRFTDDQPLLLHTSGLVGQSALLPLQ